MKPNKRTVKRRMHARHREKYLVRRRNAILRSTYLAIKDELPPVEELPKRPWRLFPPPRA